MINRKCVKYFPYVSVSSEFENIAVLGNDKMILSKASYYINNTDSFAKINDSAYEYL